MFCCYQIIINFNIQFIDQTYNQKVLLYFVIDFTYKVFIIFEKSQKLMKTQELTQNKQTQQSFDTAFFTIFNSTVAIQEQLDTLRQLLNEQISFNLKDLYVLVAGTSSAINYRHVLNFLKQPVNQKEKQNFINSAVESVIRYYNGNNSLNLSFSEFSSIFLNRQNRLLMKMTLERDSIGTLPNYILNFSRKILSKQIQLHLKLLEFRKQWSSQANALIQNFSTQDEYFDQERCLNYVRKLSGSIPERVNVQFQIFLRYLKPFSTQRIPKQHLTTFFTNVNCQPVQTFLKQKSKKKSSLRGTIKHPSLDKPKKLIDPYIRPQFHDCLTRPKITDMFSYREVKSIQKHLNRINQPIDTTKNEQITMKMKKFQTIIEKNCQKVLQAIKDIVWLQKEIQYARVELSLCPDFYPVLFFECFHKDKQNRIIPSAMEIYFKQFGIKIPLSEIYLLFKRYAWYLEGKMDFNSFCAMFDVCETAYSRIQKNRQIKSLADVDVQTKKNFLILLATIIKNQKKIDNIKIKLQKAKDMSLRDVFACFDTDDDGYLSITDFRVVWKKYFNLEIAKEMIHLLWFRMGYTNQNQLIKYEEFIKQMVPKSNSGIIEDRKLKKIKSQNNLKFQNKQNSRKIK